MAPDGRTFYSASPSSETLVAVDISNPSLPVPIWFGNYDSHGLSISDDGNRAYVAGIDSGLIILDTSEVQARVPNPTVREVARLQWDSMSIPQNAIPVTINGHPYLVEIDEFGAQSEVGAGRIIDIGDETQAQGGLQPAPRGPPAGELPRAGERRGRQQPRPGLRRPLLQRADARIDPGIVACSMILSGLRVFDIRDPRNPREIAYFNAPVTPRIVPPAGIVPAPSNWAMSSPSFVPERGEIWYSDGLSGFYAVRVTNGRLAFPCRRRCRRRRGRARAWPAARRSVRATSAASGWATPASGCCACRSSRCGRPAAPSAIASRAALVV